VPGSDTFIGSPFSKLVIATYVCAIRATSVRYSIDDILFSCNAVFAFLKSMGKKAFSTSSTDETKRSLRPKNPSTFSALDDVDAILTDKNLFSNNTENTVP
jgi:hypothetical protein